MNRYSHQADHGWPKTSHDENNNNRYQPNAPLAAYCGRCRKVFAADEAWVREELELEYQTATLDWRGNPRTPEEISNRLAPIEQILMSKIRRWNPYLIITSVGTDGRGRLTVEWVQKEPEPVHQGFWVKLRDWLGMR